MAGKNNASKYWIYGEDAELTARFTSYITKVMYNRRASYIRALMQIAKNECSIEDHTADIEALSLQQAEPIEDSIESKLMWEAIRQYLPKLNPKECEVMIALYINRLSVSEAAVRLNIDVGTVRRRRNSACEKIRKAMEDK